MEDMGKNSPRSVRSVLSSVNNAIKRADNAFVNSKIATALIAPVLFGDYVMNRIYNRSSFLQNLNDNLESRLRKWQYGRVAKAWAKETGADAFAEAWYKAKLIVPMEEQLAEIHAKSWAKETGASAEVEKEYANKLLYRRKVVNDYDVLTRNEFKKKYPHIKTPESTDSVNKRPSVARLIKSIRGYRVPNDYAERVAFTRQLDSRLGIVRPIH